MENERLEDALEKVSSAAVLLRKAREFLDLLEMPEPEPFLSVWVILILLIIIVVVVIVLVYLQRKKKLKPILKPYMDRIKEERGRQNNARE